MHKPESVLGNETKTPLRFWERNGTPNLGQTTRPYNNNKKKTQRICKDVDFTCAADHRVKLKECEKRDKYVDLARELI